MADYDGDGKLDVVSVGWFSKNVSWWKNPGTATGEWKRQDIETKYNVEFAFLVDADSDGKALEILPQFGNGNAPLTWYEFKGGAWQAHVVSPKSYGHGIGLGDVNGDKRNDIVTPKGGLRLLRIRGISLGFITLTSISGIRAFACDGRERRRPGGHRHLDGAQLRHLLAGAGATVSGSST